MPSLLSQIVPVDLGVLQLYPGNPRRGDVAAIAESLEQNQQYQPLVVQESTGYILAGNHTYQAAERLGWDVVDVVYVDVTDEQARKIVLSSNRTAQLGGYDNEALADLLASLNEDFTGTGYNPDDMDDLLAALDRMPVLEEQPTAAAYAETPEQIQARLDHFASALPKTAFGVREAVLVLPQDEYAELQNLISTVRTAMGGDVTAGEAVLRGLRSTAQTIARCTEDGACDWCRK